MHTSDTRLICMLFIISQLTISPPFMFSHLFCHVLFLMFWTPRYLFYILLFLPFSTTNSSLSYDFQLLICGHNAPNFLNIKVNFISVWRPEKWRVNWIKQYIGESSKLHYWWWIYKITNKVDSETRLNHVKLYTCVTLFC